MVEGMWKSSNIEMHKVGLILYLVHSNQGLKLTSAGKEEEEKGETKVFLF